MDEHLPGSYEDVKTTTIALVGLIGAIVTFAVMLSLMALYYYASARQVLNKQINQAPAELSELVARQEASLAEYRWVDQSKGVVAIPIDQAMKLVVAELSTAKEKEHAK
jgi:dsRNA-specific ribonuclease